MVVNNSHDIDFGILQEFANDSRVTDMVVSEDGRVWVDCGQGLKECKPRVPMHSPKLLREYAVWLCAQLGKRLDDACPIADASTNSGIRIHAVLAPVVAQGAALSVRFPTLKKYDLLALSSQGMFPKEIAYVLGFLVKLKANILITGSTGSGKTTLMKALLAMADSHDRIISVEETRELGELTANHVSLSVREANVEGVGEIGLSQLVKATLRMRPDRIVLGECRGEEIADLLRVFTSGHKGGMTTIHADEVEKVPARLMALGLLAKLEPAALCALAAGAFDVVIHVERASDGRRMVREIGVLQYLPAASALQGKAVLRLERCFSDGSIRMLVLPEWKKFAKCWRLPEDISNICASNFSKNSFNQRNFNQRNFNQIAS